MNSLPHPPLVPFAEALVDLAWFGGAAVVFGVTIFAACRLTDLLLGILDR